MSKKIEALEQRIIDLMNERNGLEVETERLHGVLKKKNEHISRLEADIKEGEDECNTNTLELERLRSIIDVQSKTVIKQKEQIKELEHKDTMFLSVNITGEDDIDALLNQAEKSMGLRLAKKGLKDKYILLAKPDTIGIEIHR